MSVLTVHVQHKFYSNANTYLNGNKIRLSWGAQIKRGHFRGWGHFFLNMIIKEKRLYPQKWH